MLRHERLAELIKTKDLSYAKVGARVGISAAMVGKLARGEVQNTSRIYDLAAAVGASADYLMGRTDDPNQGAAPPTAHELTERLDVVMVPQIDLRFSMGGGTDTDNHIQAEPMSFSRAWIQQFTSGSTSELFFARGAGDSMYPTIGDGDVLLIDRSQNTPTMGDQIWAITQYGLGMIKRLRPTAEGYKILSDNPNVPPDTAADGSMHIIGRVIAVVRRV
ncbi:XRE family transcriptional regulator [Asticcacaulis sp.]|uniref:XRE family transcriptional regulator n=1 Tax=Asticcacaulis sp. TaxID=1872648 RepID=UPI00391896DA